VAVSIDGTTIAVTSGSLPAITVYTFSSNAYSYGSWVQSYTETLTGTVGAIALNENGSVLVVGLPTASDNVGATRVYRRAGTTWAFEAELVGTGAIGAMPRQGTALAITDDGNTIAVGGPGDTSATGTREVGAVWVFTHSAAAWDAGVKVSAACPTSKAATGVIGCQIGASVAITSTTLLAGAPLTNVATSVGNNDNVGVVFHWERGAMATWSATTSESFKYEPIRKDFTGRFGLRLALSRDGIKFVVAGVASRRSSTFETNPILFSRSSVTSIFSSAAASVDTINTTSYATSGTSTSTLRPTVALSRDGSKLLMSIDQSLQSGLALAIKKFFVYAAAPTSSGYSAPAETAISTSNPVSYFGSAIAMSGDAATAVIGAYGEGGSAAASNITGPGAVYVFGASREVLSCVIPPSS